MEWNWDWKADWKLPASLVGAAGLGAGALFLFEPRLGRRRRILRDRLLRLARVSGCQAGQGSRDAKNRLQGVWLRARKLWAPAWADDEILKDRIRAKLGRVVSHPHAVQVTCQGGRVVLSGAVLKSELEPLLGLVWGVKGVREVDSKLDVHEQAENMPALQGEPEQERMAWLPSSPAARFGLGLLAALVLAG